VRIPSIWPFPRRLEGYVIVIGSMKSGTSSLHVQLAKHPGIKRSKRKEAKFFLRHETASPHEYEREVFSNLDKRVHRYTLESSTDYAKELKYPMVAERLAAFPGRKRLIYIMRHPIARIESHLAHLQANGRERWDNMLIDVSSYAKQLDAYARVGLLDDILLLDFEEFRRDPVATANKVFDFLPLKPVPLKPARPHNVRRAPDVTLTQAEIAMYSELLRPDVRRLIEHYGYEPARTWGIV
jgi:hypothetical protein